ncbi:galactose-3-O-sulfotransferase 2-like [Watersipora subatra]|uniref:galactose-3-O-sulfotransferase 2-like n=1 Tax=Watersipora subatra TaxID=2589382 RepID=UPI00355B4B65
MRGKWLAKFCFLPVLPVVIIITYHPNRLIGLSQNHDASILTTGNILNSSNSYVNSYVNTCLPADRITHFIMTKVEKTGSSTLFAILARFILENQVNNILQQHSMYHINWNHPRGKSWSVGPRHRRKADVLIDHAKYNEKMFSKHIAKDAKYIVPVREPESWISSAASYYSTWTRIHKSADKIIKNKAAFYMPRRNLNPMGFGSWFHLTQLQWLGFDYNQRDDLDAIKSYIDYIVPKIDILILNEQYDASLLILMKRFCWEYTDMFYKSYMVQSAARPTISPEARHILFSPEANLGEQLLYERINETWWNQREVKTEGFWEEVEHFKDLNARVSNEWCREVTESGETRLIEANRWHGVLSITKRLCLYLRQNKQWLTNNLLKYSRGQKKNFLEFQ